MDALKDRVGGFMECTLTMACPVLVAVATKKVDLSIEGNAHDRHNVVWPAAVSLFLCQFALFPLGFVIVRRSIKWPQAHPAQDQDQDQDEKKLRLWTLGLTKFLVHVIAILQMLLARTIFHLITMSLGAPLLSLLVLACLVVGVSGLWSVKQIYQGTAGEPWEAPNDNEHKWWHKNLELSLDLSAAVTSLLFLALEGLALEGQTTSGLGNDLLPSLRKPVGVIFSCCVVSSTVMVMTTMPPIDFSRCAKNNAKSILARTVMAVFCGLLALCLALVVIMILAFLVYKNEQGAVVKGTATVAVPTAAMFVLYCCFLKPGGGDGDGAPGNEEDQNKPPASLEMTKVTFTAFLVISLPSFRGYHLSGHTEAFVVTAAIAVIFGIGWRLFSHWQKKAALWTSKAACLCANAFLAVAAIELLLMANQALPA